MGPADDRQDSDFADLLVSRIRATASRLNRPVRLMEVCGTHSMAICRGRRPLALDAC